MELNCGRCRKPFVETARPQGLLEHLLKLVYTHPYHCQVCDHRFHVMQWGVRPPEPAEDRRHHWRRPVKVQATIMSELGDTEGTLTELSSGGCTLEARDVLLQEASILGLRLNAFDFEPPIGIDTAIVRSARGSRFGVEFLRLVGQEEERLARFMMNLWLEGTQMARRLS